MMSNLIDPRLYLLEQIDKLCFVLIEKSHSCPAASRRARRVFLDVVEKNHSAGFWQSDWCSANHISALPQTIGLPALPANSCFRLEVPLSPPDRVSCLRLAVNASQWRVALTLYREVVGRLAQARDPLPLQLLQ
jgi:hypothetical protein